MQIAQQAGVTRPVFYFYFETKYAVVAAALEQVWNEFDAARTGVRPDDLGQDSVVITRLLIWDAFSVWRRHGALLNACAQARASDAQLDSMWRSFVGSQCHRVAQRPRRSRAHPANGG